MSVGDGYRAAISALDKQLPPVIELVRQAFDESLTPETRQFWSLALGAMIDSHKMVQAQLRDQTLARTHVLKLPADGV